MKLQVTTSLIPVFLLVFGTLNVLSKHSKPKPGPKDTCEERFTDINGTIRAFNKSSTLPKDKLCNWYINFNNSNEAFDENHLVFLIFDEILLGSKDTVTIFANGKPLKFFDGATLAKAVGMFPVLTGQSNITITVDPTITTDFVYTKSLQVHYLSNSECRYDFIPSKTAIFQSPLYDHDNNKFPIECAFTFAVPAKGDHLMNLWFDSFIFHKGEISVDGAEDNNGKYNSTPPVDLLVKDILQLNVTIFNQSSTPEIFKFKYDSVTKLCSSILTVTSTSQKQSLKSPEKDALRHILSTQEQSLNCLWLVNAPDADHTITLTVTDSLNLPEALDNLLILDGPNRSSNVLLDLTSGQKSNERVVYSSGPHLWISATSPFVSEDFYVELVVSLTSSGGHLHGSGDVFANDDTTFLLDVQPDHQVKLNIDLIATSLTGSSVVNFYQDFLKTSEPFLILKPGGKIPDVVVSPTEKMTINMLNFDKSVLKGFFSGIEKGCYKDSDLPGDTFSIKGHCNNTCAWIVHPVPESKDVFTFHFQTVSLTKTDLVLIRKMDPAQTLIANISFPKPNFPDLWLPADTGTFIQVVRKSCPADNTIIQTSYQTLSGCGTTLNPKVNDVIEISSPNYPSHYPLGANCTWTVVKPDNAPFLHVSVKDLRLAQQNHTLIIFSGSGSKLTPIFTSNYTNKELPDDMPVFDNLTVTFSTNTEAPQESLPGFKLGVAVVGRGAVTTDSTGTIRTPSFPQPETDNLLSVWFVTANSTSIQQQLLNYTFSNKTDFDGIENILKIYDGGSLHSPVVSNFTNETALSRTNRLLFVYQKNLAIAQPGFLLTYQTHACNMSMLCDNNVCMHEDWFCNGVNDCGDYSDERDCEGRFPNPPTPEPSPSDKYTGASVGVLSGAIVASFILGVILALAIPFGYRKWKTRGSFSYGPVNS